MITDFNNTLNDIEISKDIRFCGGHCVFCDKLNGMCKLFRTQLIIGLNGTIRSNDCLIFQIKNLMNQDHMMSEEK